MKKSLNLKFLAFGLQIWPLKIFLAFDHFLAFLRSTELKSLIFESKLHVFAIETVSTPNLANSISVYRGKDPNEHRTRRHKYDYNFPPDENHRKAPYGQTKQIHAQKQMHPTRFTNAQRDMAGWKEYLAYAVKSPVFSFLCPL